MQISSKSSASGNARLIESLPPLDPVLEEQVRTQHSEVGGADRDSDLDQRRLVELHDNEDIKQRHQQHGDRHDQPKEQIGDVRRLPAIARSNEHRARFLLADPFAEIEVLNDGLHVSSWRLPERHLARPRRQSLALTLPYLLAFEGHRLHARGQRIPRQQGHRQREHRRTRRDRGKQHGENMRIDHLLE
jgi:hypothetical protein